MVGHGSERRSGRGDVMANGEVLNRPGQKHGSIQQLRDEKLKWIGHTLRKDPTMRLIRGSPSRRGSRKLSTFELFKDAQKGKLEELDQQNQEAEAKSSSQNTILFVLIILIVVTWGIAATAYFGIVDYKGLLAKGQNISAAEATDYVSNLYPFQYDFIRHPLKSIGNFLTSIDDKITDLLTFDKAPYIIVDKRRSVVRAPVRSLKRKVDLSKRDAEPQETVKPTVQTSPPTPTPKSSDKKQQQEEKQQEREDVEKPKPTKTPDKPKQPEPTKPPPAKEPKPTKVSATKQQEQEQTADGKPKEPAKKKKPRLLAEEDKAILDKLKEGEKLLAEKKIVRAFKFFKELVEKHPDSPKAKLNRGRAEGLVADEQRSNPLVQQAINTFTEVAAMPNCPKELKKQALMAKSDKEGFLGRMKPALETQLQVSRLFPKDVEVLNKLGVRYLMLGRNKDAKKIYEQVLQLAPDDGFALVHKGFIVKNEGGWTESIPLLTRGTESDAPGTQEGKFYFHLGDALHRTNRSAEAEKVYEKAAKRGLFRSKYQRSLYNVDHLRGKPYWTPEEAGVKDYVRRLEMNWKVIRDEALSFMDKEKGLFQHEEESLKDTGEWRQFTLFQRGNRNEANCRRTPKTCKIMEKMPNARGCRRGQIKFSVMMPGTHVWPHTGPTNCRLRMHLGLVIPKTGSGARLACSGEMRTWEEGKVLIFDDSFEHEVWQEAESFRLILIVDIWHPDLTEHEKKTLSAI